MTMTIELSGHLILLAKTLASRPAWAGFKRGGDPMLRIGRRFHGKDRFFVDLESKPGTFAVWKYDEVMIAFSRAWPDGLPWPEGVPRPAAADPHRDVVLTAAKLSSKGSGRLNRAA